MLYFFLVLKTTQVAFEISAILNISSNIKKTKQTKKKHLKAFMQVFDQWELLSNNESHTINIIYHPEFQEAIDIQYFMNASDTVFK